MLSRVSSRIRAGVVMVGLFLAPSAALGDASTSPGRNSVFVSASSFYVPPCCISPVLARGEIARGKRNRVLSVEVMLRGNSTSEDAAIPAMSVMVNGIWPEPTNSVGGTSQILNRCEDEGCTVTGMFFLDLDAAEALYPGTFINRPLVIELFGTTSGSGFWGDAAVLRARLEKK